MDIGPAGSTLVAVNFALGILIYLRYSWESRPKTANIKFMKYFSTANLELVSYVNQDRSLHDHAILNVRK